MADTVNIFDLLMVVDINFLISRFFISISHIDIADIRRMYANLVNRSLISGPYVQTLWNTALKTSLWLLISTHPGVSFTISSSSACFSSSNTSHWMINFSSSILRRSAIRSNIPNPWNKQNTKYYVFQISTCIVDS